MKCDCLPDYCNFVNCSLKQINRSVGVINFAHRLKLNITDVELKFVFSIKPLLAVQNNYRHLFIGKVNLCPVLKHTQQNIVISPFMDAFMDYSNFLQGCPFQMVTQNFYCLFSISF